MSFLNIQEGGPKTKGFWKLGTGPGLAEGGELLDTLDQKEPQQNFEKGKTQNSRSWAATKKGLTKDQKTKRMSETSRDEHE